jgi:hypothetical protein
VCSVAQAFIVGAVGLLAAQHRLNIHTSIFSRTVTEWVESWLACSLITTGFCTSEFEKTKSSGNAQIFSSCYHLQIALNAKEVGTISCFQF